MAKKETTWQLFRQLLKLLPGKWLLGFTVLITVLNSVTNVFFSYYLQDILDAALKNNYPSFWRFFYLLVVITIGDITFAYLQRRWAGKYAEQGVYKLRELTSNHLSRLGMKDLESQHSGDYVSRLTNDINVIRGFAGDSLVNLIFRPLSAILAFILLLSLSWKLTLTALIMTPLLFLGAIIISRPIEIFGRRLQATLGVANSLTQDMITGAEVSRAFGLRGVLQRKFGQVIDDIIRLEKSLATRTAMMEAFSMILGFAPFFICFGFGGYWVIKGDMTPGGLIAFVNLLNPLTFPIAQMPRLIADLRRAMAATSRITEILNTSVEREDGQIYPIANKTSVISLRNLSFTYDEQEDWVLRNLSFDIKPGEHVAIVGPSGSGKSTIMKLLLGYYENFDGEIKLFGESIHNWNLKELREHIALVAQDTFLFPGSIEENIGFGNLSANKDKIQEAAKAANAHDFITDFTNGYQTEVGELGGKMSGGQKQRLSIARAILKNAPLLLLDEATSALDTESEILVQEALDRMMANRTTLVIAHRLSTILNSDRILVLDHGTVVEEGKHEELLKKGGIYAQLYNRQLANEKNTGEKEAV